MKDWEQSHPTEQDEPLKFTTRKTQDEQQTIVSKYPTSPGYVHVNSSVPLECEELYAKYGLPYTVFKNEHGEIEAGHWVINLEGMFLLVLSWIECVEKFGSQAVAIGNQPVGTA